MFSLLLNNLLLIFVLVIIYLFSFGANTILGIYNNLSNFKEEFSKEKLKTGLIKGAIILLGTLIIVVNISLIPAVLDYLGIVASEAMFESVTIVGIGTMLMSSAAKYLTDAVKKLYTILGIKGETK